MSNATNSGHGSPISTSTAPIAKVGAKTSKWTDDQATVPVHQWRERNVELESSRATETWQKIVEEVNKAGAPRTTKQCKDKIRNLKQAYKEAKSHNKETGNSPKTSPFYDEFDEVLATRPVVTMPGVIQSGGNTSSSSSDLEANDEDSDNDQTQPKSKQKATRSPERPKKKAKKEKPNAIVDLTETIGEMHNAQLEMMERAQTRTEELLLKLELEQ
jgi:hypothetical protein